MIYYQACTTFSEEYWEFTAEPEGTMQIKTNKIWNHFSIGTHCKETGKMIEKTKLQWFNSHKGYYIYLYDMTVLFFQFKSSENLILVNSACIVCACLYTLINENLA